MFKNNKRMEILLWLSFIILMSYIDRVNFSMAAPLILKAFDMTPGQLGMIFSAFTIGYTIFNYAGGFMVEKYKSRQLLTFIIVAWSFFVAATPLAWSFTSLMIIRIGFGLFEGPMIPAIQKLVHGWMTPKERGMASGLWLAALPLGIVIGNPLSGLIIDAWGWHSVFYIYGAFGLIAAFITWKLIRNKPEEHPGVTPEELNIIQTSFQAHEGAGRLAAKGSTLGQLMANPWLWVISVIYFALALVFWANLNWLPTYFIKARGSSLLKSGFITMIPWVAGAAGAFIYGWLSDHFGKIRAVWLAIGLFIMAPFIAFAVYTPSLELCLISFVIAIFFNMGAIGLMYAICMEVFAPPDVAKASGIMLAWGSFSGIISPTLVGFIVQYTGSFNAAYYTFALVSILGAVLALALISKERAIAQQKQSVTAA